MRARKTPAKTRAEYAEARVKGKLVGSAVTQLNQRFLPLNSAGEFIEWRKHPLTVLFIDALRELAIAPPAAYVPVDGIGVEYGLTSGIGMAASLLDDPSAVFPNLFSGATPGSETPTTDTTYALAPDHVPEEGT